MKYSEEFKNKDGIHKLLNKIKGAAPKKNIKIMEVCGGHTMSIKRYGLSEMLPDTIKLISGPGCPVCVTPIHFVDQLISFVENNKNAILVTFGEMLRIPGSISSLGKLKSEGADIRVCYSPVEAIAHAEKNPSKDVVLVGVGFETTAPTIAAVVLEGKKKNLKNLYLLSSLKTMPVAMRAVLESGDVKLDGMICPGHVSAITGVEIYNFIPKEFGLPCTISGFEPIDLLIAIYDILMQIQKGISEVNIEYKRVVNSEGNQKASEILYTVFEPCDANWRGFGMLKQSGLQLKNEFKNYDASLAFNIPEVKEKENKGCICASIIRGADEPPSCKLFGKVCTPENPCGPCMVSDEGTCAAYFQYSVSRL